MTFEETIRYLQEHKNDYTVYIDFEYVVAIPNDPDSDFEEIKFKGQPRDIMFDVFRMFDLHCDTT